MPLPSPAPSLPDTTGEQRKNPPKIVVGFSNSERPRPQPGHPSKVLINYEGASLLKIDLLAERLMTMEVDFQWEAISEVMNSWGRGIRLN